MESENAPGALGSSAPGLEASLAANLYGITLESPDPRALAGYYTRVLGFRFEIKDGIAVGSARERRITLRPGEARRLSEACYVVASADHLESLSLRLRRAGLAVSSRPEASFAHAIRFTDPDGNKMLFVADPTGETPIPGNDPLTMRPARLQHLVLASTQTQALVEFYCNVVGFKVSDTVLDDQGVIRSAFLNCGPEHHSLAIFAARESRLDHFCFEAGDWMLIRDWADHFASQGIPVKWGPGRHGPGNNLFVFVHDSDGNWVEISAELEHVAPDRPPGTWKHEQRTLNSWGVGLLRS
jgi:catechol 2,3-dioxygenase